MDILDIVDICNLAHLDEVYTRLGLQPRDIVEAQLAHPNFPRKQAKMLLQLWVDRNAAAATRGKVIAVMMMCPDCSRGDMNRLIEKWNSDDSTVPGMREIFCECMCCICAVIKLYFEYRHANYRYTVIKVNLTIGGALHFTRDII